MGRWLAACRHLSCGRLRSCSKIKKMKNVPQSPDRSKAICHPIGRRARDHLLPSWVDLRRLGTAVPSFQKRRFDNESILQVPCLRTTRTCQESHCVVAPIDTPMDSRPRYLSWVNITP